MPLCATKLGVLIQRKELLLRLNANTLPAETFLLFPSSQEAIRDVHVKGIMYRAVEADIGTAADLYIALI